jgi:hypothetical protein
MMRYTAMPNWAFVLPVVIGVAFMFGAVVFMLAGPPSARFIGPIWLLMDAAFVIVCLRALRRNKDEAEIRQFGRPATATLLEAKPTGEYVERVPQWSFRLQIDGNGAPYQTKLDVLTFNPVDNGATFEVRVDPARKEHVVLAGTDGVVVTKPPVPPAPGDVTVNPDGSTTFSST